MKFSGNITHCRKDLNKMDEFSKPVKRIEVFEDTDGIVLPVDDDEDDDDFPF